MRALALLRYPYYQFPVPCETNGEARTYSYAVNTNLVTPVIAAFPRRRSVRQPQAKLR